MNEHIHVTVPARFLASPDFLKQLKSVWGDEKKMQEAVQFATKRLSSTPFKDQDSWKGFVVMIKARGEFLIADVFVPEPQVISTTEGVTTPR